MRVVLLFGGRSEEHEISIMSARSVYQVVNKQKYTVIPVAIDKKGHWLNPEQSTKILENNYNTVPDNKTNIPESIIPFLKLSIDVVFPLLHGPFGEDGKIQGFLETLNIPYVGAGVTASALGMDKAIMKQLYSFHNLPQTKYKVIRKHDLNNKPEKSFNQQLKDLNYPLFIKPANLGSSIGINKVNKKQDLNKAILEAFCYDDKIIVEEGIKGKEIECSVLGNKDIAASLPGEILPAHEFYDYQAKYEDNKTKLKVPADLNKDTVQEIQKLAIKAFKVIDGKGMARVDFFLTEDNSILINELNTIPGFTQFSMYARMWEAAGLSYSNLIDKLIKLALQ